MPDNNNELYKITHSNPEYSTVGELLADENSVTHSYFDDPESFLNVKGQDGLTNRQRIESMFVTSEERLNIGLPAKSLPIKVGTLLYVEYEKINETSFLTEGIEVVTTNEPAFKAAELARIEADYGYIQVNKIQEGQVFKGVSQEYFPEVSVWIWCRALSPKSEEDEELTGQLIDISPFIQKCTTNMSKNGGNWTITLPPLVCELDNDRKWVVKKGTIDRYVNTNGASIQGEGYVAQVSLFDPQMSTKEGELVRSQFYFHNIIRPNDLIFIRFETLDMEKRQRYQDANNFYISKDDIAGRLYDMIGLVDSNTQNVTPTNNDVTITIEGRDLSKLFIEDGTYFYALENSQGMLKFAGQSESKDPLINRIFGNGSLQFLTLYMFTGIDVILKFIIQHLSNIEIIPDGLFSSYGDRINKRFNVVESPKSINAPGFKPQRKLEPANGIWKIVKLVIDESVSKRRIQDSSFSSANGSLLNFLRTVAQEPLVEMWMDTYGDMYHLVVRKPPYDQKALISLLEGKVNTETGVTETPPVVVTVKQVDVLQETLRMDDTQIYSWYHFFPRSIFFGDSNSYSLSYLGAIFFKEYAQLFGSKPFQAPHPYMPYVPMNNSSKSLDLYEQQAINDLKYVVETSQYLPFTRKGTLVLNRDRRIKVGNIIRYESTGEIFFVDAVQHDYQITNESIQAVTVVNVSRGMIEQLIYGAFFTNELGERRYVSYFNIINTELVHEYKEITKKVTKVRKVKEKAGDVGIEKPALPFTTNILTTGYVFEPGNTGMYYLEKYNAYPENKKLFIRFINEINKLGYYVILIDGSTNRSYEEQAILYRDKRNAKPGHSRHERGAAIDITLKNKRTGEIHSKTTSKEGWVATGVPALANTLGLQWAGGDGSFGTYIDRVHFQIMGSGDNSKTVDDQYEEYTEEVKSSEISRDKIFSNFKVNKFSFNFFNKNLQFDPSHRKVTSRNVFQNDQFGTPVPVIVKSKKNKRN